MLGKITTLILLKELGKVNSARIRDLQRFNLALTLIRRVSEFYPYIAKECFSQEEIEALMSRR